MGPPGRRKPQWSIYVGAWSLPQWLKFIALLGAVLAIAAYIGHGHETTSNAILISPPEHAQPVDAVFPGRVVGVADGDTINVMHSGQPESVRLWGIDAPEAKQPFGTRARQFAGDLAFGKAVTVRIRDVDRYRRIVAEIILPDGRNLNREIVRAGFAWWYEQYAPRETVLRDLQSEARAARRGLWADPKPVPPWEWRRATAPVRTR